MVRSLLLVIASLLMGGCATGYQPTSLSGGYSETQLSETAFQVSFSGNAYTPSERASDFALLRCADIALERGFPLFVLVDSSGSTSYSSYTTPATTTTNLTANTSGTLNYFGNTAYYSGRASGVATSTTTGGKTIVMARPHISHVVLLLKDKPADGGFAFDARLISNSIRAKYGLPQN